MHYLLFIHKNVMSLYMFRALNAHLQEDTLYTVESDYRMLHVYSLSS